MSPVIGSLRFLPVPIVALLTLPACGSSFEHGEDIGVEVLASRCGTTWDLQDVELEPELLEIVIRFVG